MESNFQKERRTILIAGAGIAGLATALFIARAGYRVEIFEQAPKLEPVGSGLQLSPNAMAVLAALELDHQIKLVSTAPSAIEMRNGRDGKKIGEIPLGREVVEKYGQPYLVIHRSDLQKILYSACRNDPDIKLRMGVLVRDAVTHPNGVSLIADSRDGTSNYRGIGLVGADGVNSVIRNECIDCKAAIPTGTQALRALVRSAQMPADIPRTKICMWLAPDAHAVIYPVRGENYHNIVLTVPDNFGKSRKAKKSLRLGDDNQITGNDIADALGQWDATFNQLLELNTQWLKWPLIGAPALGHWSQGDIVLVGDAAHAMTPHAAQGAAMGLEDAAVLGWAVKRDLPLAQAFELYYNKRIERTNAVARLAQRNKMIFQLPQKLAVARNLAMRMMGGRRILNRQDWIYRWKPPTMASN